MIKIKNNKIRKNFNFFVNFAIKDLEKNKEKKLMKWKNISKKTKTIKIKKRKNKKKTIKNKLIKILIIKMIK